MLQLSEIYEPFFTSKTGHGSYYYQLNQSPVYKATDQFYFIISTSGPGTTGTSGVIISVSLSLDCYVPEPCPLIEPCPTTKREDSSTQLAIFTTSKMKSAQSALTEDVSSFSTAIEITSIETSEILDSHIKTINGAEYIYSMSIILLILLALIV